MVESKFYSLWYYVQNKTIDLGAFEWHDDDSGIEWYNYTVYHMNQDGEGYLTENLEPLTTVSVESTDESIKSYTFPKPGMYSIILKVCLWTYSYIFINKEDDIIVFISLVSVIIMLYWE